MRCNSDVTKIPVTIGAVDLVYNVPGLKGGLRLTPDTVAGIFLSQIQSWNDAAIRHANPNVQLPHLAIQVVYRADGSGTTYIVTHYLSDISSAWSGSVGSGST